MSVTCNKIDCGTHTDLESLIVSLFAKDTNGCVGLKIVTLDTTACADVTDLKECGMHLNIKQAIVSSIVDDGCGGFAAGILNLAEATPTPPPVESPLKLTFDTKANADTMIGGDAASVADWNTFFGAGNMGTPFDNISVLGTAPCEVSLFGGANIKFRDYVFGDNDPNGTSLLEVDDTANCVIECGHGVFSDYGNIGNGCYELTKVHLPICNTLGNEVFVDCSKLADLNLDFDGITVLGDDVFEEVPLLPQYNFPNLVSAGDYCFLLYPGLVDPDFSSLISTTTNSFAYTSLNDNADFSSLTNPGNGCFEGCVSLINPTYPSLTTISHHCFSKCSGLINPSFLSNIISIAGNAFADCTGLTSIDLSSCTDLGGTTGDDGVFFGIIGNIITLTIPHALETDGDIVYLLANNTVTVVYSD